MTINDIEINEITFGEERKLYNLYKKAYRNSEVDFDTGEDANLEIDWDAHDLAIGMALELAIKNPDEILKDMSHPEIDKLGQQILIEYLRLNEKSKKI